MKRLLFLCCILFSLSLAQPLQASHSQGGNFWIEHLSGCTYRVYCRDYVDCGNILFGTNGIATTYSGPFNQPGGFQISGAGCGTPTAIGGWTLVAQSETTPLCPIVDGNGMSLTQCQSGTNNPNPPTTGFWERIGYRDYSFCALGCSSVRVSWSSCCWGGGLNNIGGIGNPPEYIYLDLNIGVADNSTPVPNSSTPMYMDRTQSSRIGFGFSDPDGDSLVYSLSPVYENATTQVTYAPGYTATQPLGPTWNIQMDSETGETTFEEVGSGSLGGCLFGYLVEEYRDGVLLSSTHVVFELWTVDFSGLNPISSPGTLDTTLMAAAPISGGGWLESQKVSSSVGTPLSIPIHGVDPTPGDSIWMILHTNLPGMLMRDAVTGILEDTVSGQSPSAFIEWTPTAEGHYFFELQFENLDECGQYVTEQNSYLFEIVVDSCQLIADIPQDTLSYCTGSPSVLLSVTASGGVGPYTYTWSNGATLPSATVNSAGTYFVSVDDQSGCTALDSVEVIEETVPENLAGQDTVICPSIIGYTLGQAALPGYTYQWFDPASPGTTLATTSQYTPPLLPGDTGTYSLSVVSPNGCADVQTVTVSMIPLDGASIIFSPDTICVGDTVVLNIQPPSLLTSTMSVVFDSAAIVIQGTAPMIKLVWDEAGDRSYQILVNTDCGGPDTTVVNVHVSDECAWPGDTDTDGIADNNDLLNIGLGYGQTGPARANAGIQWAAQPFSPWAASAPTGENYAHSDTDGNGIINDNDTLAIVQNYGLMHLKRDGSEGGPGDPDFLILPAIDSALIGDTLALPIVLGTTATPADSIYGLAFTIQYDSELIDSASAGVTLTSSWLGTPGTDLLSVQKDSYAEGELDVAITRTDQMDRMGAGTIALFNIVMIDDLAGKNGAKEEVHFNISDVTVIDQNGDLKPVYNQSSSILLTDQTSSLERPSFKVLSVMPNPSTGELNLVLPQSREYEITVIDSRGREMLRKAVFGQFPRLSLNGYPEGVYLINVMSGNSRWSGKILLRP